MNHTINPMRLQTMLHTAVMLARPSFTLPTFSTPKKRKASKPKAAAVKAVKPRSRSKKVELVELVA